MKGIRTSVAALALLSGAGLAHAADLLSSKDAPAQTNLVGPAWNGFYGEFGVGPGFTQTKVSNLATLSEKGTEFTARLGYDYRWPNSRLAVGVWGDVGNSFDVNGSALGGFVKLGSQWEYALGGRVAYDHGAGQIYVLGGAAWNNFNFLSSTTTLTGFRYGGGVNVKVTGPFYVGLELTQTDWGSFTAKPFHFSATNTDDAVRVFTGVTF